MSATLEVVVIRGIFHYCIIRGSVLNTAHGSEDAVCVLERGSHFFSFRAASKMADQVMCY
jgi:hypothetical protein